MTAADQLAIIFITTIPIQPDPVHRSRIRAGGCASQGWKRRSISWPIGERGINTLIISGTATQVCCESTARDAMMLNYKVFFVSDANATFTDDEHNATLSAMAHTFCDVIDTRTMIDMVRPPVAVERREPVLA